MDIDDLLAGLDVDSDDDDDDPSIMTKDSIEKTKKKKKTKESKTKDGKKKKKKKDGLSLKGGPTPMSLGGALDKLGGPSLKQKDFGRGLDDNDTFCGLGTVDEKELSKAPIHGDSKAPNSPKKVKTQKRDQVAKKKISAVPSAFNGGFGGGDDSDSDEEDLFADDFGGKNPFQMPSYRG